MADNDHVDVHLLFTIVKTMVSDRTPKKGNARRVCRKVSRQGYSPHDGGVFRYLF